MYHDATVLVMLTTTEPKIADQNPATLKFCSIDATKPNIAAFRTNMKRPIVTMVNGSVNTNAIGLTIAFTSARRIAEKIRLPVPRISTPGTIADAKASPSIMIMVRSKTPLLPTPVDLIRSQCRP